MFNFFKKDFLLGIGAGLIVSGIAMSWFGNGQLTDEEIVARAAKLGMIQKQATSQPKAQEKLQANTGSKSQPASAQPTESNASKTEPEPPKKTEPESPKKEALTPKTEPTISPSYNQEKVGTVTIEIKPGTGSETVARILEEKGVITDREEFYKVMSKYKAHSRLKVGTFKIPAGSDMKEIVNILTGKAGE